MCLDNTTFNKLIPTELVATYGIPEYDEEGIQTTDDAELEEEEETANTSQPEDGDFNSKEDSDNSDEATVKRIAVNSEFD